MLRSRFAPGLLTFVLLATTAAAAAKTPITPAGGPASVGPYSPGILAGGYLYVSGQGARARNGEMPGDFASQVRQTLDNVKAIVEAAGLTLDHVVYTHAYVKDLSKMPVLDQVYAGYFPSHPPARAVIGVADLPGTPVEINAVAVVDKSARTPVSVEGYHLEGYSAGMLTADRLYLSSLPGRGGAGPADRVERALDAFESIARAAGLDLRHVVFVNPYLTAAVPADSMNEAYARRFEFGNTPARATIRVNGLPEGDVVFTGVAVRDLRDRKAIRPRNMPPSPTASPCVLAGDTLFCSAKSGFIPGPHLGIYAATVQHQVRQTMRNLLDGLEEADMDLGDAVAAHVYLEDIAQFASMNEIYAQYVGDTPPTRTTVQQTVSDPRAREPDEKGRYATLEQISIVAVRPVKP